MVSIRDVILSCKVFIRVECVIVFTATLDGSLGYILPIQEKTYRRLLMLQNVLVSHIPHTAGLNPKAYR